MGAVWLFLHTLYTDNQKAAWCIEQYQHVSTILQICAKNWYIQYIWEEETQHEQKTWEIAEMILWIHSTSVDPSHDCLAAKIKGGWKIPKKNSSFNWKIRPEASTYP